MKNIGFMVLLIFLFSCKEPGIDAHTKILTAPYGTRYTLQVTLPDNYDTGKPGGYPLLLYTDVAYMKPAIDKALKNNTLKDSIIAVGIGYEGQNRRTEDLSPTATLREGTGNAAAFAGFIQTEVLGHLRDQYAISTSSENLSFCGHSLGGLFGLYLFLKKAGLFHNYILISPSLMWDEQAIFQIEREERAQNAVPAARLFLAAGSLETGGFHTTRQHLTGLFEQYYPAVTFREKIYRNKDHTGVIAPAVSEGLTFIYQL